MTNRIGGRPRKLKLSKMIQLANDYEKVENGQRVYTMPQLAINYGVSTRTVNRYIKELKAK